NLPAADKMTPPNYQTITNDAIPSVRLDNDNGHVRIIAGEYAGKHGPAKTFSPMHVWDIRLEQGRFQTFSVPEGWNTALIVLQGTVQVNGDAIAREAQMVILDKEGRDVSIEANNEAVVLL